MNKSRQLALPGIALAIVLSLVLSCGLVACEKVVASTQPAVVRIIDASYSVPAINLNLDGAPFAANIGQGAFTKYGTLAAKSSALITITPAAGGQPLISARSAFLPGHPQSILISDNDLTPAAYTITMLDDQRTPAAAGHSAFRFVNRALKAGARSIFTCFPTESRSPTLSRSSQTFLLEPSPATSALFTIREDGRYRRRRHDGEIYFAGH